MNVLIAFLLLVVTTFIFKTQKLRLAVLCLLCPIITLAQSGMITGKVVQADTKAPVRASVFLSNSSFGTETAGDGTFTLNSIKPGQYTLIVNALGYQQHTEIVLVSGRLINLNIELAIKTTMLKGVSITALSKADWKLCYGQFKGKFIGTDKNAGDCKIINPDVLNISHHKATQELDVNTDDFLIIENRALGYRLKFLIQDFKSDGITHNTSYAGDALFEDLHGNASQQRRWLKNRNNAYYGSAMHFYRSSYQNDLNAEGFEIYHLTRQPYPKRTSAPLTRGRLLMEIDRTPDYYKENLDKEQWQAADILKQTRQPGIFAITFPDCLYVIYKKKHAGLYANPVYRPVGMPDYQVTIVSLVNDPPYALFDANGVILSNDTPLYEGAWSASRLSDLLPVNYIPTGAK
jgi:hypothetical protein